MKKIHFLYALPVVFAPVAAFSCSSTTPKATDYLNKKDEQGNYVNIIDLNDETHTFTLDLSKEKITQIPAKMFLDNKNKEYTKKIKVDGAEKEVKYTLNKIIFPETLESIGNYAFTGVSVSGYITELDFSKATKLVSIGENAFEGNEIKKLSLPASLKNIQANAFANNSIEELTIPENSSLETISIGAFNKNKLTTLNLANSSLKTISRAAFKDNEISSITLAQNSQLAFVGDEAFAKNKLSADAQKVLEKESIKLGNNVFAEQKQ
ncbi:leucine-rich repeat domain-containing protein [Mycoplasma procyoni]|uniref:leucine-rich repeat domain-containing protein n=1 Tax=Mycoplasma procyoni TaxID=568784 RepID=UPI00197B2FA7|nr:leucine-rich repeat domain-containing protein [Mycoplasma procyoni]MBN3534463.1 leucine-rich repeat domain-containing protein [Mycoplasma procyoni]